MPAELGQSKIWRVGAERRGGRKEAFRGKGRMCVWVARSQPCSPSSTKQSVAALMCMAPCHLQIIWDKGKNFFLPHSIAVATPNPRWMHHRKVSLLAPAFVRIALLDYSRPLLHPAQYCQHCLSNISDRNSYLILSIEPSTVSSTWVMGSFCFRVLSAMDFFTSLPCR